MKPAAERLGGRLTGIDIRKPGIPVLHNVNVSVAEDGQQIREYLEQQL